MCVSSCLLLPLGLRKCCFNNLKKMYTPPLHTLITFATYKGVSFHRANFISLDESRSRCRDRKYNNALNESRGLLLNINSFSRLCVLSIQLTVVEAKLCVAGALSPFLIYNVQCIGPENSVLVMWVLSVTVRSKDRGTLSPQNYRYFLI